MSPTRVIDVLDGTPSSCSSRRDPASIHCPTPDSTLDPIRVPNLLPVRALGTNLRHQQNSTPIMFFDDAEQGPSDCYKQRDLAEMLGRLMIKTLLVAEKKIRLGVGGRGS